jgi:hypothetical protein
MFICKLLKSAAKTLVIFDRVYEDKVLYKSALHNRYVQKLPRITKDVFSGRPATSRNNTMQPKFTQRRTQKFPLFILKFLGVCKTPSDGGKKPSKMDKNWILHHDNVPIKPPVHCSSFW